MKKNILILFFAVISTVNAQNIDQLMQVCDNLYILENIELFTKQQNEVNQEDDYGLVLPKAHRSVKIVNINSGWLQSISNIIKHNPSVLYPYLDSETQNLASYILLLHVLKIELPKPGMGFRETVYLNRLSEGIFNPETLPKFNAYKNTPSDQDPAEYVLNTIWKDIVNEGANARLKAAIEALANRK